MIEPPLSEAQAKTARVLRGRTIVVPEAPPALQKRLDGQILLKCGDKITTDHIMPAGTFLKLRSNVPEYAKVVFNCFNEPGAPTFAERALALKSKGIAGVIVAGESYGQGSSREHAALCPMYLGVRVVIAKTIERIHRANLINFCIVPIRFADPADYDKLQAGDELAIDDLIGAVQDAETVKVVRKSDGFEFVGMLELSSRDREVLLAAGLLSYTREKARA
jgi:aconitate hydratase